MNSFIAILFEITKRHYDEKLNKLNVFKNKYKDVNTSFLKEKQLEESDQKKLKSIMKQL